MKYYKVRLKITDDVLVLVELDEKEDEAVVLYKYIACSSEINLAELRERYLNDSNFDCTEINHSEFNKIKLGFVKRKNNG